MRMKALFSALASAARSRRSAAIFALLAVVPLVAWSLSLMAPGDAPVAPLLAAAPAPPAAPAALVAAPPTARAFAFRSGTTFSQLFTEFGLDPAEVPVAVAAVTRYVDVRKVRAGEGGFAYFDAAGKLVELRFKVSQKGWLTLTRAVTSPFTAVADGGWKAAWRDMVRTVEVKRIEGELASFLFDDLQRAGGSPQLAYSMSDVLQWDLDFDRDLQLGDRFGVVYEEIALDGEKSGLGRVLSLYYDNKGKHHEAYLYAGENGEPGYYDGEGRPLQKLFLRSPLPYMRVTSKFSHSRLHPVLKVYRPHYGVDLGAPYGTPVRATSGGVVTFARSSGGGAGLMVTVRHPQNFESSYLHLSKIAPGIKVGSRVSQGDILGNVGNSGHSTGAHLDYRIKKNGQYLDPMGLKNQPAEPIPQYRLAEFLKHRDIFRASLREGAPLTTVQLASLPKAPVGGAAGSGTQTAR
jgi:murein DD-endopeptidase MepM/ murein hydrolase activator NlpD